ncbi:MAG: UDP-2,4-diacetamido-2,4,6-trideoxy-beta-L-altropyranose hydrolase [Acidobacteriota bacterium]
MIEGSHLSFRVDASPAIGAGHFMRCLALAEEWRARGGQATFIGRWPAPLARHLEERGIRTVLLDAIHPDPSDLVQTLETVPAAGNMVLDGYRFDAAYQGRLRHGVRRLLVIDDAGHLPAYDADILLNQNLHADRVAYQRAPAQRLLGPRYVLLRREFLRWDVPRRPVPPRARHLLVTLGGGDQANHTLRIAEALLAPAFRDTQIRVVIGPANPHAAVLERFTTDRESRFQVIEAGADMPALMAWADLAISAAGTTSLEFAFMGLPCVLVAVADNQEPIGREMESRGAAVHLGMAGELSWGHLVRAAGDLIRDPERRLRMSENGRRLVDGGGVRRVIEALG